MQYLADLTLTEFAPILTIIAGMLIGFYGIAKMMLIQATKDRDADRLERKDFSEAIKDMAKSNREVATSSKKAALEAERRNGHLAELTIQSRDQIVEIIKNVGEQHVIKQTVDEQTIKK